MPADASAQLTAQFRALSAADSESAFVAAAGTSRTAKTFARQAWRAREALGASAVELRYVSGGDVADRADGSAVALVDVSWRAGAQIGLSGDDGAHAVGGVSRRPSGRRSLLPGHGTSP